MRNFTAVRFLRPPQSASLTTRPSSALVAYLLCPQCGARFYGQPLLRWPACPSCERGRLHTIGSWDLTTQPWWPLVHKEVVR